MCGRLSQYTGLHEFVDALSMPNALVNLVGETAGREAPYPVQFALECLANES